MGRFSAWLFNFMRGRYGFDELGRHLGIGFIVLVIVSVVLGVVAQLLFDLTPLVRLGALLSILSIFVNWGSIALLIWMFYRVLSRNPEKRRAENERFLERRARHAERRGGGQGAARGFDGGRKRERARESGRGPWRSRGPNGAGADAGAGAPRDAQGYEYLSCPFCGQRMRVPRGKGKLAVKCPSCGEKTIVNS